MQFTENQAICFLRILYVALLGIKISKVMDLSLMLEDERIRQYEGMLEQHWPNHGFSKDIIREASDQGLSMNEFFEKYIYLPM